MKDMEEMIAIMQAYNDGKQIQIKQKGDNKWTDYLLRDTEWDWKSFDYRVKPDKHLPATWEEFCETHPKESGEAYINMSSEIRIYKHDTYIRDAEADKSLLPNKEYAEAMLALCQLIQLRDCYNKGWQPEWKFSYPKYAIEFHEGEIQPCSCNTHHRFLAFKTEELRDEFLKNFKDLIEIAKPLL